MIILKIWGLQVTQLHVHARLTCGTLHLHVVPPSSMSAPNDTSDR